MSQLKNHLKSVVVLVLFFIVAVASNPSKKVFSNSASWLPKDFDASRQTLLIEKFHTASVQEKAENYVKEKYPYSYEFVSREEIYQDGKYNNKEIYRFALMSTVDYGTIKSTNGTNMPVSGVDFFFFDRKNKSNSNPVQKGSSNALMTFKPVINTIVKQSQK